MDLHEDPNPKPYWGWSARYTHTSHKVFTVISRRNVLLHAPPANMGVPTLSLAKRNWYAGDVNSFKNMQVEMSAS